MHVADRYCRKQYLWTTCRHIPHMKLTLLALDLIFLQTISAPRLRFFRHHSLLHIVRKPQNSASQQSAGKKMRPTSPFYSNYSWSILFRTYPIPPNVRIRELPITKSFRKLPVITDITFIDAAIAFMRIFFSPLSLPLHWLKPHEFLNSCLFFSYLLNLYHFSIFFVFLPRENSVM